MSKREKARAVEPMRWAGLLSLFRELSQDSKTRQVEGVVSPGRVTCARARIGSYAISENITLRKLK